MRSGALLIDANGSQLSTFASPSGMNGSGISSPASRPTSGIITARVPSDDSVKKQEK